MVPGAETCQMSARQKNSAPAKRARLYLNTYSPDVHAGFEDRYVKEKDFLYFCLVFNVMHGRVAVSTWGGRGAAGQTGCS